MTAARNYVHYNPDSHLAGCYRNLVKAGMDPVEANKRVARALVRVIFKKLSSLVQEAGVENPVEEILKAGESDMASGSLRSDRSHKSNISLSSLKGRKARRVTSVKRMGSRTSRKTRSEKKEAVSKKTSWLL
jgi:hypothetical protein